MTPGSAVSVTYRSTFSSLATAATPSGMPMPRFTTPPIGSSNAQRRAITLRSSSGSGGSVSSTALISPENAGLYAVAYVWWWCSGLRDHDTVDEHAGHHDLAGIERALCAHALDLRDDEAVRIARGHGEREIVERERLALHRDVARRRRPSFRAGTRRRSGNAL